MRRLPVQPIPTTQPPAGAEPAFTVAQLADVLRVDPFWLRGLAAAGLFDVARAGERYTGAAIAVVELLRELAEHRLPSSEAAGLADAVLSRLPQLWRAALVGERIVVVGLSGPRDRCALVPLYFLDRALTRLLSATTTDTPAL